MDQSGDPGPLAALLQCLKERSGLSYAELARRTFTTSSSLHRYCTGGSVPRDYALVAAVARECGATAEEMRALALHWAAATAPPAEPTQPADPAEPVELAEPVDPVDPVEEPVPPRVAPPRPRRRPVTVALSALVLVAGLLSVLTTGGLSRGEAPRPARVLSGGGDTWTWFPWPVGSAAFGVTMNSNTGTMPSFRVGSVRFWDSGTRWADLEPRRGEFAWAPLDRLVAGARRAGVPALLTLGGTPAWAAPDGPKTLYADGSSAAPPDDLADWDRFVRALATRYRGRLEAYELWDTATDRHFYSGSPRTLAEMVRRAARIVRSVDARATVVCPSMGRLRTPGGPAFLRAFARFGGYRHCDAAALKPRQNPAREAPETMSADVANAYRALHEAGVGEPLWITGPDYDVSTQPPLRGARARDYAARFYLTALYERHLHVDRFYFYDWGGTSVPIVLQAEGRAPSPAARGVERLEGWLDGARIGGCGHGTAAGLPPNAWQCRFTGVRGAREGARIGWTDSGTAVLRADARGARVRRLDGTAFTVRGGGAVPIGGQPELIAAGRPSVTGSRGGGPGR